jgi:uncharacterized protein (DUF4213/DUF364 family)
MLKIMKNTPVLGCIDFLASIQDARVHSITIGKYWVLVESSLGNGLVTAPPLYAADQRIANYEKNSKKYSLHELALLVKSEKSLERRIGCAAINSATNRHALKLSAGNGLELTGKKDRRVVVVGRFPKLEEKIPHAIVLEQNPGPKDLPEEEAVNVIPDCTHLIITASTWANGSLGNLLLLAKNAHISLIGPGTPFSPIMKKYGISRLAGFMVHTPTELSKLIKDGAGVRQFKHLGHFGIMEL